MAHIYAAIKDGLLPNFFYYAHNYNLYAAHYILVCVVGAYVRVHSMQQFHIPCYTYNIFHIFREPCNRHLSGQAALASFFFLYRQLQLCVSVCVFQSVFMCSCEHKMYDMTQVLHVLEPFALKCIDLQKSSE